MAKYKAKVWWYELHGGEIEVEADSPEDAKFFMNANLKEKVNEVREKGDSYSDDGNMGYSLIVNGEEEEEEY